jgi:hypothetical protein
VLVSAALLAERDWPAGRRPLDIAPPVLRPVTAPTPIATKFCPKRHPNNPDTERCTVCQMDLRAVSTIVDITPEAVARLLLEDGTAIDVAEPLLIGRSPRETTRSDTLTVTGRQVSRVHFVLEVAGWQLLIRDADSTNGTFLARPGERGRLRVPTDSPVAVHVGDTIQFGSRQALVTHAR